MRVLKPIVFGALVGLGVALSALAGLYLSPLRQDLYFAADPALVEARSRLEAYQDWLAQADARIALQGPEADSLRAEQAGAWRDYKGWRTRLGELARAHARPSGSGFLAWVHSLGHWAFPAAGITACLCALLGFLGARLRSERAPARPHRNPRAPAARPPEPPVRAKAPEPPPTDLLPIITGAAPPAAPVGMPVREPDTAPLPVDPGPRPSGEDGRETALFQVGPGWGQPPEDPLPARAGLSMEDEDAGDDSNTQATLGIMPPTTEVERVERRKEEVLRLARKGMTSSEISRRLRISQDQVEFIIRLRREKG